MCEMVGFPAEDAQLTRCSANADSASSSCAMPPKLPALVPHYKS